VKRDDDRNDIGSTPRSNELYGTIVLVGGCLLFAGANALAKSIVLRGTSELSLIIIRGFLCYMINGGLLALRCDPSLISVMLFRINLEQLPNAKLLATGRGCLNALALFILFVAWDHWVTIADAMAIFVAVQTIATTACARLALGSSEKVTATTIAGGAVTLLGAGLVIQPSWIFASTSKQASPVNPLGICLCIASALCCTAFNLLTRYMGVVSPSMFLSFEASSQFVFGATVGLGATLVANLVAPPNVPGWLHLEFPCTALDCALTFLYCCLVTGGQLSLAAGYSAIPAGKAAILCVSELAFAYVIGVGVLREPTSILAGIGTLVVLLGSALVAADGGSEDREQKAVSTAESIKTMAHDDDVRLLTLTDQTPPNFEAAASKGIGQLKREEDRASLLLLRVVGHETQMRDLIDRTMAENGKRFAVL